MNYQLLDHQIPLIGGHRELVEIAFDLAVGPQHTSYQANLEVVLSKGSPV